MVYGDTDSVFVLLEGASLESAFQIGEEIARRITNDNPEPVKLKFEKVYCPSVLLSKKHYVGYKYDSDCLSRHGFNRGGLNGGYFNRGLWSEFAYEAKGIETVRRDSCLLTAQVMENCLRILFDTFDLSLVKKYFRKVVLDAKNGQIPIEKFVFSKEVRLGTYRFELD